MENINGIWGAIIGAVVTLGVSFFTNVWSKKTEAEKEVQIAEINSDNIDYNRTKIELAKALQALQDMSIELKNEQKIRVSIEQKFEAVKLAFTIIFNQYSRQFKDDPEQLNMLEELRKIINDEQE